jgi:predicted ribosomally synthesized peptide with SipW-like signal peptide
MKSKIYVSLVIIALVGGLGYAATQAFFTARETSTDSKFTVGTLDLSVNDQKDVVDPFIVSGIGASGNISGGKEWTVKNIGTLPGRLFFSLENLKNQENDCNKPEKQTEAECEANEDGELGSVITAKVSVDGTEYVSSTLETANQAVFGDTWKTKPNVVIPAGGQATIRMEWNTPQEAYDNRIQSDSLSFDAHFDLEQLKK